ncbi:PREDICTED: uncharacterized protein LOC109131818, partial [Camelina sativa]|uniref:Uncharacterized protein LOC109131818 n=1 Tax=Camelina sativa TaxID=90675 RepID=A0ABM1RHQ5_CAMSA
MPSGAASATLDSLVDLLGLWSNQSVILFCPFPPAITSQSIGYFSCSSLPASDTSPAGPVSLQSSTTDVGLDSVLVGRCLITGSASGVHRGCLQPVATCIGSKSVLKSQCLVTPPHYQLRSLCLTLLLVLYQALLCLCLYLCYLLVYCILFFKTAIRMCPIAYPLVTLSEYGWSKFPNRYFSNSIINVYVFHYICEDKPNI